MTISRANIKSQMKGNKMKKKKPVVKAKIGKLLETVSPAYSIMKGKGPIADAFSKLGESGLGGIAGMLASQQKNKRSPSRRNEGRWYARCYTNVWWRQGKAQAAY